jgi:Ca2+-binding EF-hand superfamily protein
MREAFSVLDSNSTGYITASSVIETLSSLGLQDSISSSSFFPPNQTQQLSLPQFLNQLANILVALSPQQELLNAFAAFDDDDSGQVDIAELRDALLNTTQDPGEQALTGRDIERALDGFTGRRVFSRSAVGIAGVKGLGSGSGNGSGRKNGDVFRYQEFVGNLTGGPVTVENGPVQTVQAR